MVRKALWVISVSARRAGTRHRMVGSYIQGTRSIALPALLCRKSPHSGGLRSTQPHPIPLTVPQVASTPFGVHHAHSEGFSVDHYVDRRLSSFSKVRQSENGSVRASQPRKEDERKMRKTLYAMSVCGRGPTEERAQ